MLVQAKGHPLSAWFHPTPHLSRYGLEIVVGADIGGGLFIAHPVGTVVGPKRIGRNCSIIAAVTIGMRDTLDFPEIGDEVFIGAGARVLGKITIGDRAVIGPNALVISDLPAGATAVGMPAHIIRFKRMPTPPAQNFDQRLIRGDGEISPPRDRS